MNPLDRVPYLSGHLPDGITDEELRALQREIVVLTDEKAELLSGALEIEGADTTAEIHIVLRCLDNYKRYPDIQTSVELGRMLVDTGEHEFPDHVLPYVDFARVANEYEAEHNGLYTRSGYVLKIGDGESEQQVQEPYIVELELTSTRLAAYGATYKLSLPTDPGNLDEAMAVMVVDSFEECELTKVTPLCDALEAIKVSNSEIEPLNVFGAILLPIYEDEQKCDTFYAAVEAEGPESVAQLLDIAQNLHCYTLYPECHHPADYGEHILYDTSDYDTLSEFSDEVHDFIKFDEYGAYRMEEDGIKVTANGYLRSARESFANTGLGMRFQ